MKTMKNKSFLSPSILSGVAALALFMPSGAWAQETGFAKLADWHISPVTQTHDDTLPYCALASQYDNRVILTNTRNRLGKGSLALEFPNVKFKPDELYRLDILVGDGILKRSFAGKAVKETMLVIKIGQDEDFFDAMSQGHDMMVQLEKGAVKFPLAGHAKSFFELKYCVDALPPIVQQQETFVPTSIKEEEKITAPIGETSVYAPKVTPPTLQEKYKLDQQKRAQAARKFNPIPIEDDTAAAMAGAIEMPVNEQPTVLKSGYVSPKKRLYTPETANEDISEDQREASLKATLEKARAKALGMAEAEQTAEPITETLMKVAPVTKEKPSTVMASTTQPERVVPAPTKAAEEEIQKSDSIAWKDTAPVKNENIMPSIAPSKTVPPVDFDREQIQKPAVGSSVPPVETSLSAPDIAHEEPQPTIAPASPELEPAPAVASVITPPPVQKPVQRTASPIQHTIDFSALPPETVPVAPWQVDLVGNVDTAYCSLSTVFDNNVRLFVNRSADGLSTVGIDFGIDLLQSGKSYKTTLAAQNLYEETFKAKAHNPKLLIIQAGNQDALHYALLKSKQFIIAIPGAVMALNTAQTAEVAADFHTCLGQLNTSLDRTQEPVSTSQAAGSSSKPMPQPTIKPAALSVTQPSPQVKEPVPTIPSVQAKPVVISSPVAPPQPPVELPKSTIPVKQAVPIDQDPSIMALQERAERNRELLKASIQKTAMPSEPISYDRAPAPQKKLAPLPKDEVVSFARIPAPQAKAQTFGRNSYGQPVAKRAEPIPTAKQDPRFIRQVNENLSLIEDSLASPSATSQTATRMQSPLEQAAYPVEDILHTSDINVSIQQSSDTAFKWINPATGVKGEVTLLSTANGTDNIDYLLALREEDTESCANVTNFSFQIGDTSRYNISTVTSADSLCITPMNVSSSTYILHNNGVGLYQWHFSGETPSALMVERDKILGTINANVNN